MDRGILKNVHHYTKDVMKMESIDRLIDDYVKGNISEADRELLQGWVLSSKENQKIFASKIRAYAADTNSLDFDAEAAFANFLEKTKSGPTYPFKRWMRYAAVLLLLIGLTIVSRKLNYPDYAGVEAVADQEVDSLFGDQITLTLADGTKKILGKQGHTSLTNSSGQIVANSTNGTLTFSDDDKAGGQAPIYGEIYIPYGQKFKMELTDGTQIWLNSGTRLTFVQNLANTQGERKVVLDGEAFFDVAKDKARPFVVETGGLAVNVLGTQFNVNGYSSEPEIATTLVEGAVAIGQSSETANLMMLSPMDQASFTKKSAQLTKKQVDTDLYTAWIQDRIMINNLTFAQIMDKLERAYNLQVNIETEHLKGHRYQGEFKNGDISSVLSTIALSTPFTYKIHANEVTIME